MGGNVETGRSLSERVFQYLVDHHAAGERQQPLTGSFSLLRGSGEADLYGMIDAVYILYTIGLLTSVTTPASRCAWAERILACQDENGWFSLRNLRGHSREHATAYAVGALCLLENEPGESYVSRIKPLKEMLPILSDPVEFSQWIHNLGFQPSLSGIFQKKLGWHYIWRGSHVGGGIAAAAGMARELLPIWWPGEVDPDKWFDWYFTWLDEQVSPKTGLWHRAFWNYFYHQPTLIDMGGAVHFYWIYEAMNRRFPYPEKLIESTLSLQKSSGLYKNYPFCIDLDGNFNIIRAYLQLTPEGQAKYRDDVYQSAKRNFEAVVRALMEKPLEEMYHDSHGLPGALAALVECTRLPGFQYSVALEGWQHPLDKVWWL